MPDLADVLDVRPEVRLDEALEVLDLTGLAALGGDLQGPPGAAGHANRAVRALLRAHAPEEEERLATLLAHRIAADVDRVADVRNPGKTGRRRPLAHRERDEPDVVRHATGSLVHGAGLARERAVHGVDATGTASGRRE